MNATSTGVIPGNSVRNAASEWIFVGVRSTLRSHNSYLTRTIHGVAIVVCADRDGSVRAFENACAHRQMPIQPDEFGRRALICPYHAWTYDHTGQLRAVANAHLYGMRGSERTSIRLKSFAIEVLGGCIFVNLSDQQRPLSEQIGAKPADFLCASSAMWSRSYLYMHFPTTKPQAKDHDEISSASGEARPPSDDGEIEIEPLSEDWRRRLASTSTVVGPMFEAGRAKEITCRLGQDVTYRVLDGRIFILEQTIAASCNHDGCRHVWALCADESLNDDRLHLVSSSMKAYVAGHWTRH